ncbi:MAG TPA: tRNA-(ms[2]io[6]A)-hydroxylase [Candidatus Eisenbacteria bacterium]|nr:tRNA-(ms[2]io[6]A)-hydroxylase [Candidatus Eisenbacteria bacterium]
MLGLASETSPAWVARALAHLDEMLVDHAHCEKKAASTAVSLLFRYPERSEMLPVLSALAREELSHFEQMLELLAARGIVYRRLAPAPYATDLLAAVRSEEPERLLDTLLCLSLIEARSCERMKLLAEHVPDPELAVFYRGLLASEARHHQGYVELAAGVAGDAAARARLGMLAAHEASVIAAAPPLARMHA